MSENIKRANNSDANIIGEVFNLYRVFYKQESNIEIAQKYITERLTNNEAVIFFAEDNCRCIGFTQLYPTFDSVNVRQKIVLYDLFVREEYRRKGFAKLLMNAAKQFASDNNFGSIELSTAKTNTPGQSLYESLGYIRDNEYYTYDLEIWAWVWSKDFFSLSTSSSIWLLLKIKGGQKIIPSLTALITNPFSIQ